MSQTFYKGPESVPNMDRSFYQSAQNTRQQESLERHNRMMQAHEEWADTVETGQEPSFSVKTPVPDIK